MTPRAMLEFVTAEPFRAFRLHMASGRTFEIGHPEMIKVGRSSVTVYARPTDEETEQPERWQDVSLMRLKSAEPLGTKPSAESR